MSEKNTPFIGLSGDKKRTKSPGRPKLLPQKLPVELLPLASGFTKHQETVKKNSPIKQKIQPKKLVEFQELYKKKAEGCEREKIQNSQKKSDNGNPVQLDSETKTSTKQLQDFFKQKTEEYQKPKSPKTSQEPFILRRATNLSTELDGHKPKKRKVEEDVVRRKLFVEPGETKKMKRNNLAKTTQKKVVRTEKAEVSIGEIVPLDDSISVKLDERTKEKASVSSNEEFLGFELAVKTPVSAVCRQLKKTVISHNTSEVIERCCSKIDVIQKSFKQQLEKLMADTDKELLALKQELLTALEENKENKHLQSAKSANYRRSPRLLRKNPLLQTPADTNLRMALLNKRTQNQYLMLQDTPRRQ